MKMSRGSHRWKIPLVVGGLLILVGLVLPPRIAPDREYSRLHNETNAIKAIQTIHTMEVQYQSEYGRYATSLAELGDLIDSGLAAGEKSGYKFTLTGYQGGYAISAVPLAYGSTGKRAFYSDQGMVIRENDGPAPATARSREMK
jgi:type IV pilus assembly protein PilA